MVVGCTVRMLPLWFPAAFEVQKYSNADTNSRNSSIGYNSPVSHATNTSAAEGDPHVQTPLHLAKMLSSVMSDEVPTPLGWSTLLCLHVGHILNALAFPLFMVSKRVVLTFCILSLSLFSFCPFSRSHSTASNLFLHVSSRHPLVNFRSLGFP